MGGQARVAQRVTAGRRLHRALRAAVMVVAIGTVISTCATLPAGAHSRVQFSSPAQIAGQRSQPTTTDGSSSFVSGALRSPGGPYLYDREGRVVVLHGVNAVYKRPPYELTLAPGKPWNFTAADAREIAGLGFDVVRLGILWEGIEPGHGGPNNPAVCTPGRPGNPHMFEARTADRYLAAVTKTVDLLGRYHVYSLIDMHQDVYSQAFRGEGAPAWAVCTDGRPIVALGGRWSHNYSNPLLVVAEHHFWRNDVVGDLQGQFDLAWSVVAHHFADNPWVVGYDPYNEPFSIKQTPSGAQGFAVNLECFYTGRAHPTSLQGQSAPVTCPADDPWEGVVPVIEAADPHHLVFPEPDNFSVRQGYPSLLGPLDFPRLVYNFHTYCRYRSPVTGDPTNLGACDDHAFAAITQRGQERAALASPRQPGGPGWLMTEFGATRSAALVSGYTDLAGDLGLGWIYWAWKYYDDPTGSSHEALAAPTGALAPTASVLDRPYAQALAGNPLGTSFDAATDTLRVAYAPSRRVSAPTVIVVPPARHYPEGYCATVVGGAVTSPPGAAHLLVTAAPRSRRVTVTVAAGACRGARVGVGR